MTVTMTIATLFMTIFWGSSTGAVLAALARRARWMKLFIGLSVTMLVVSTALKPLTLVDLTCGLAITMLLGTLYVFIGWKVEAHKETKTH